MKISLTSAARTATAIMVVFGWSKSPLLDCVVDFLPQGKEDNFDCPRIASRHLLYLGTVHLIIEMHEDHPGIQHIVFMIDSFANKFKIYISKIFQ